MATRGQSGARADGQGGWEVLAVDTSDVVRLAHSFRIYSCVSEVDARDVASCAMLLNPLPSSLLLRVAASNCAARSAILGKVIARDTKAQKNAGGAALVTRC